MSFWEELKHWFSDPCPFSCAPGETELCEVTVHKGDTLSAIAQKATGDAHRYMEIVHANPERHWDEKFTIRPGEKLRIPWSWVH